MTVSQRLTQAAGRFLHGHASVAAAQELEGVLIEEYLGDERTEELLHVLSLYSPGGGKPYSDVLEVRHLLLSTLEDLA